MVGEVVFLFLKREKTMQEEEAREAASACCIEGKRSARESPRPSIILREQQATMQRARGHERTPPMTTAKTKQRNAEAATARRFLKKAPAAFQNAQPAPRFVKITHSVDGWQAAAATIQQKWRGLADRRDILALRMAMAASKQEAAAAAAKEQVEVRLEAELARLMAGLRLSSAAVLRGDRANLQAVYGPAAAVVTRAVQAVVRMRRARKAVAARRAEVESEAHTARQAEAKAAAKAAKLAARKAAAGAALKAAAQKERALVLEQLCDEAGSNSCEPWCVSPC